MSKWWHKTKRVPPLSIAIITVAFFALNWDTRIGHIKWEGTGKYVNEYYRYSGIFCAAIYLVGYYRKNRTLLMLPILFVLGFGIAFGLLLAICFPLGLDITGNTAGQTMNNGTHIELLPTNTTSAPNVDVSTTKNSSDAKETSKKESISIYGFVIVRSILCLILWILHYVNYVDRIKAREKEKEEADAANDALA